ncbi:MAG: FG-GAP and VCBS repeat-containing protein [Armatimonadota bacterium]|nr:FG-GAP and VCBS repeat-containing protein [Armatimonadota bacterium]
MLVKQAVFGALLLAVGVSALEAGRGGLRVPTWRHLSTSKGDLPVPVPGTEQTACVLADLDKDGAADIVVAERTTAPSLAWLRRTPRGWQRYVIDDTRLYIEAGGAAADVDGDGDTDLVFGGDSRSNQVWWWENPFPRFSPDRPWIRRVIKGSGAAKHHHQVFADVTGDGRPELFFWNQRARQLCMATIPADPRSGPWPVAPIYQWSAGAEHEGLVAADVDADGQTDLVGGGAWYRREPNGQFSAHVVDESKRFASAAAGQLKAGGWLEVVFVPGDADGPLTWYEWDGRAWRGHVLLEKVVHGHSLQVADLNGDGYPDIFVAEMAKWGPTVANPNARAWVFYGDGRGAFREQVISRGIAHHESKVGDVDGDGDLDIVGKPYNWETPRIDVWLNEGARD